MITILAAGICFRRSSFWLAFCAGMILLAASVRAEATTEQEQSVASELLQQLEEALEEKTTDVQARLATVESIEQSLNIAAGEPTTKSAREIWYKARFVRAVALMRMNRINDSMTEVTKLRERIDANEFPELSFRCGSLSATLLRFQGRADACLQAYVNLLTSPDVKVSTELILRARTNYAVALIDTGRVEQAIKQYEEIILIAIEQEIDSITLHAGNNLVVTLLELGDTKSARKVIQEVKPTMARNRERFVTYSLQLRALTLLHLEGQTDESLAGLRSFLEYGDTLSPSLRSTAQMNLAEVLLFDGQLQEALDYAQQSVANLDEHEPRISAARLVLAKALIANEDYENSLLQLAKVAQSECLSPSQRLTISALKLKAQLLLADRKEELQDLETLLQLVAEGDQRFTNTIMQNFDDKLATVHRNLAAQTANSQRLAAEATTSARRLKLTIVMLLCGFFGAGLLAYGVFRYRQRLARTRLEEQRALNEKLEALVEYKTRELTTNMQARAEMAQALERKRRIEAIGMLAGNVAHDVNNLLQVIANVNELLGDTALSSEQRAQALQVSNDSLRHGSGVIQQLLAFSRRQDVTPSDLSVSDYFAEYQALFQSVVGDRIELNVESNCEDHSVHVDPSQLTSAVINILSNAKDAMPHGGKVQITTSVTTLTADQAVLNPGLEAGDYVKLIFRDNGCGMKEEQISRAFEPFFSSKRIGSGTGLGLASVQDFVRRAGGAVRIESKLYEGTELTIHLPKCGQTVTKLQAPEPFSVAALAVQRFLLVEDNEAVAKSMLLLFSHLQMNGHWVRNGDEAKQLLEADRDFCFVLTDSQMPGELDGRGLAHWIQAEIGDLRVFMMSGYNDSGADHSELPCLKKPFTLVQLKSFLSEHWSRNPPAKTKAAIRTSTVDASVA